MANIIESWAVRMSDSGEALPVSQGLVASVHESLDLVNELHLEADLDNGTKIVNVGSEKGVATGSLSGTGKAMRAGDRWILYDVRVGQVWMLSTSGARLLVLAIVKRGTDV